MILNGLKANLSGVRLYKKVPFSLKGGKNKNGDKVGKICYENGSYNAYICGKICTISFDEKKEDEVKFEICDRKSAVVFVVKDEKSERGEDFLVADVFFFREDSLPFVLNIALDDKIYEALKNKSDKSNKKAQEEFLKNALSFEINGDKYLIISGDSDGFESGENVAKADDETENEKDAERKVEVKGKFAFKVLADKFAVFVSKTNSNHFKATKIAPTKKATDYTLKLLKAEVAFEDKTNEAIVLEKLKMLGSNGGKYMEAWNSYLDAWGEQLLARAQKIGAVKFDGEPERVEKGWRLKLNEEYVKSFEDFENEFLGEDDNVFLSENAPLYMSKDISVSEYFASLERDESFGKSGDKETNELYEVRANKEFLTLLTNESRLDIKDKKIWLSIFGDETQLKRKLKARERILNGKIANHSLIDLLSENELSEAGEVGSGAQSGKKFPPLTEAVKNKVFKNPPTQNQMDAIDIALNTPDVAILQGPPGTGKTTVITAILERLNEMSDKGKAEFGSVIVTSVQHDAVSNVIERVRLNGLPTPKIGKKRGEDESGIDERFSELAGEISKRVCERNANLKESETLVDLNRRFEAYLSLPTKSTAKELLEFMMSFTDGSFEELKNEASELFKEMCEDEKKSLSLFYLALGLRTSELAFTDDGKRANEAVLKSAIFEMLSADERRLLKNPDLVNLPEYLKKLRVLKNSLLKKTAPKAKFRIKKPDERILELKERFCELFERSCVGEQRLNLIVARYVNELKNNPFFLEDALKNYTFAVASTTGQITKITDEKLKNKFGGNFRVMSKLEPFSCDVDVVIVDEAARVTPLDLLNVVVLAKKKLILVGDHRQLPHMVDDDVVGTKEELKESDYIKKSAFEFFKERAKRLEKDGFKRVITLNNQYRTHPLLGKFVSDNFYKKYDEGFNSPLGEENFAHELEGTGGKACVWADLPNLRGAACRSGTSWKRECEAKEVARLLKLWLEQSEKSEKKLTFGVISFYNAQLEEIKREMKRLGGAFFDKCKDRFHIGSVDSFQGREFDVVLLSAVRSGGVFRVKGETKSVDESKFARSLFGFMTSENRLCVSMSRQKKSLVVVGDREYFSSNEARKYVPAMANFVRLCEEKGRII